MKLLYLFLGIFVNLSLCNAQDLLLKIDSIKIYHLPLNLRTSLELTDYDIRNWKENKASVQLLKKHVITDSVELQSFVELDLLNNKYLHFVVLKNHLL